MLGLSVCFMTLAPERRQFRGNVVRRAAAAAGSDGSGLKSRYILKSE